MDQYMLEVIPPRYYYHGISKSIINVSVDLNKMEIIAWSRDSWLMIENPKRIEYILEWNLLEKKCKKAILLYCFHTAGVLHIFAL